MLAISINSILTWLSIMACFYVLHRSYKKLHQQLFTHLELLNKLKKEVKTIGCGTIGVGQKIHHLDALIHYLSMKQDEQAMSHPQSSPYHQASKIAEIGGSKEDIMESCDLSEAEAELILIIHGKQAIKESA